MTVRRLPILLVAAATLALLFALPGIAVAYDSVHGGSAMDTDACAGCHRAHTAASPIMWTDSNQEAQSALLISTATTIEEFCYTCHGTAALGADTNVFDGVFESDDGDLGSDETYNLHGQPLNSGGFDVDSGAFYLGHYPSATGWVAYGGGDDGRNPGDLTSVGGEQVDISCTACHDTHGSANYRLLKDVVAGSLPGGGTGPVTVGGYSAAGVPDPWVISTEVGYPSGGWPLGEDRMALYTTYFPDFTDGRYAKPPGLDLNKGISGWCASCHTQYNTHGGAAGSLYQEAVYDAADGFGLVTRHRHPVNTALSEFAGPRPIRLNDTAGNRVLPLANTAEGDALTSELTDWVDCLSCHVAHGSNAEMTGYAAIQDVTNIEPGSDETPPGSVPPDNSNALLRMDNRGVCQACHNK